MATKECVHEVGDNLWGQRERRSVHGSKTFVKQQFYVKILIETSVFKRNCVHKWSVFAQRKYDKESA